MELRHLRYFLAVAEALSFSRAATRLRITQPALSRQIRDLEEELGCALLRRGRSARTELTAEGAQFQPRARQIVADADALVAETRLRASRLRIGHYGTLWLDYFAPALRRFAKLNPGVVVQPVDLTPGALPGALRGGDVEVALVGMADAGLRREFETHRVTGLPAKIALAADHPLAKRRRLQLADLRAVDWIAWDEVDFPGRKQLLIDAARRAGFRPRIVRDTDSIASLLLAVATSRAAGCVLPMSERLPHAGVVFVDVEPDDAMVFEMHVAWRRGEPRAALLEQLWRELLATGGHRDARPRHCATG